MLWSRYRPRSWVAPMPSEGSAAEKVRGVGSTVAGAVPGTSARSVAGSHYGAAVLGMAELTPRRADKVYWIWTLAKLFSTSSAYLSFFVGQHPIKGAKMLHKVHAPPSVNFSFGLFYMTDVGQLIDGSGIENPGCIYLYCVLT